MKFLNIKKLSKRQIIIVGTVFAVIGTALTLQSRAGSILSLQSLIEGESMQYSKSTSSVIDYKGASGGKVINMFSNGSITSPTFTTTDTTISVQIVAKGSNCDGNPKMTVKVDGKQIGSTYSVSSRSAQTYSISSSIPAGNHNLSITFLNDKYKKGICDRNLYIDKTSLFANTPVPSDVTAPTVKLTSPAPSSSVTGQFQAIATAVDNVGVTKVEFYTDSTLVGTSLSSPYSYLADSSKLANGQHTIYAKAYDSAGNVGTASSVVTVNNPVTSTPSPTSTNGLNIGYFPQATAFTTPITNPVIRSDSAAFMQQFIAGKFWNPNFSIGSYGVAVVKGTGEFTPFPPGPVAENGAQYLGKAGKFPVPKVPPGTKPVSGTDGHLAVIVDRTVYEIFKATVSADGTITNAKAVGRASLDGNGQTNNADAPSNAAGLSLLAGLITPEELASGHIDHALAFSVPGIKGGTAIFPAWSNVGVSCSEVGKNPCNTVLAEGSKIQLDPSVNISGLPEPQKTIAKALQTHGAYLRDNGGSFAIYGETSNRWPSSYGTGIGLGQIPWASVRVIN